MADISSICGNPIVNDVFSAATAAALDVVGVHMEWETGRVDINTGGDLDEAHDSRIRTANYCETTDADNVVVLGNEAADSYLIYVLYYNDADGDKVFQKYNMYDNYVVGDIIPIYKDFGYFRLAVMNHDFNRSISIWSCVDRDVMVTKSLQKLYVQLDHNFLLSEFGGYESIVPRWESGGLASGSGAYANSKARARTFDYIDTSSFDFVAIDKRQSVYFLFIFYFNSSYEYVTDVALTADNHIPVKYDIDKTYPYVKTVAIDFSDKTWVKEIDPADVLEHIVFAKLQGKTAYPDYFRTQVEDAIDSIKSNQLAAGKDGETFLFITDNHWDNNAKNSPGLVKRIVKECNIKHVIDGGDIITQFNNKQDMLTSMSSCADSMGFSELGFKVLFGNHDMNQNGVQEANWMTEGEFFALSQSFMGRNIDEYKDYFYFYYDDPSTKTRFICLDTRNDGVISSAQFTWFDTVVQVESGWHVLVFAHWLRTPNLWNKPLEGGVWTDSAQTLFAKCDNAESVEGIFCGHLHADMDTTTDGGIKVIATDTDSLGAYGEYTATRGTVSEQCFDVITVNYASKTIECVRVGRGVNRSFTY